MDSFEGCGVAEDSSFANLITDLENLDAPFELLFSSPYPRLEYDDGVCSEIPDDWSYRSPQVTVMASLKQP